jgi:outer membrane protein OmpA-like peptidoglycan-associated protein
MTASIRTILAGTLAASLALGACAPRRNVDLVRAEVAYRDASADPSVRLYAAPQLHDAEVSLGRAQREWEDDHDAREMRHMGYVVERQVEIARVTAQKEVAKRETMQLQGTVGDEVLRERDLTLLRRDLTLIQSRDSERGIVLTIPDVLFEVDKADLKVAAQRDLVAIATYLKDSPGQKVLIEGHTDSTGTETHNHELSLRRGTTVETFFLKQGVDPERIEVRGLGEDQPIASNATNVGRQQNRRVEIVMLNGGDKTVRTEERPIELRR